MRDVDLFGQALGLAQPWRVERSEFDPRARRLDLYLDFGPGSRFACPSCGGSDRPVHHSARKSWRHLNFFEHEAYLHARLPRVRCDRCGVRQRDLEAYARQTLAAREEEQRRIGRELHDGPLQTLVLLWRKLDAIDAAGGDGRAPMVREARDLAEATADELRRISRALRPSVLDDLGVAAALKSEATTLARRCGISVRFVQSGPVVRLPAEIELTALRIAQEALHNVERHAAAGKVVVKLAWEDERVRLTVRDDGRGLESLPSVSDLLDAGNLGIAGMQERARLVGGDFAMHVRSGEGTIVEVAVPSKSREAAPTD